MRTSTVGVQREPNVVQTVTSNENTIVELQTAVSSSKWRRFHWYFLIVIAVIVILVVCITVPLVLVKDRNNTRKNNTNISSSTLQPISSSTLQPISMESTFIPSSTTIEENTTNAISKVFLNFINDRIVGLYNTRAGQSTGGFDGIFLERTEMPQYAMDNNMFTKYVNFGRGCRNCIVDQPGIGTGFFVTPSISNSTLVVGLLFCTANDYENRDPITVTLEGSNAATLEELHDGSSWTLIYDGPTGISLTETHVRHGRAPVQWFTNTVPYASYRVLITSQRGADSSVQYSEARIIGYH